MSISWQPPFTQSLVCTACLTAHSHCTPLCPPPRKGFELLLAGSRLDPETEAGRGEVFRPRFHRQFAAGQPGGVTGGQRSGEAEGTLPFLMTALKSCSGLCLLPVVLRHPPQPTLPEGACWRCSVPGPAAQSHTAKGRGTAENHAHCGLSRALLAEGGRARAWLRGHRAGRPALRGLLATPWAYISWVPLQPLQRMQLIVSAPPGFLPQQSHPEAGLSRLRGWLEEVLEGSWPPPPHDNGLGGSRSKDQSPHHYLTF